jgi:hypothetical protein
MASDEESTAGVESESPVEQSATDRDNGQPAGNVLDRLERSLSELHDVIERLHEEAALQGGLVGESHAIQLERIATAIEALVRKSASHLEKSKEGASAQTIRQVIQSRSRAAARRIGPKSEPDVRRRKRGRLGRLEAEVARLAEAEHAVAGGLEALVSEVARMSSRLEKRMQSVLDMNAMNAKFGPSHLLTGQLIRSAQVLDGLTRRLVLDPDKLSYPERLTAQRFPGLSQNGEDGILLALFGVIGADERRFAELGCGTNGGNSGFLAYELGWSGLMVDADETCVAACRHLQPPSRVDVVQAWITREGVNDLLTEHGIEGEIDLLSIDIDGNDYWIWEAITVVTPRVVVIEYNAGFPSARSRSPTALTSIARRFISCCTTALRCRLSIVLPSGRATASSRWSLAG